MRFMTGGDLVAETLAREGVDHFIGILGGQITPLFDAIGRDPRLRLVVPRNEAAGAMMADGYARAAGKPAVVISTVGAGAVYSAAGTAYAWGDHVPIFSISPQVQSWKMYPAQESLQGCYQADMLSGVTRFNCTGYNWKRLPRLVQRALREALSGERGPVHMDVPVDVFFEYHAVSEKRLRKLIPPPGITRFSGPFLPDAEAVREALGLLEGSRRPLVLAGLSVLREGAWEGVVSLAVRLQAPLALTPSALSAVAADDPGYIGVLGHPALADLPRVMGEADLVLMAGMVLSEQEEALEMLDRSRARVIQTSPEPEILGSLGPVDAALAGDSASICRALSKGMEGESTERDRWRGECRKGFEYALESLKGDARGGGAGAAASALGEALERSDLLVLDGREAYFWGSLLCPAGSADTRFHAHGMRGTGYGLPMALGIKLARPREHVLALCDTASLLQHIQELETARRERIAVTVCVVGEPFDWKGVAEGFGLAGYEAAGPAELAVALDRARGSAATAVIDLTRFA
ncbi:MAG: thiamine pyrophosphate-binding protein [Actinobacteria bacterium]|nr:thiamine pyrophosphate-binding protein [Actinomycetota bacterium]